MKMVKVKTGTATSMPRGIFVGVMVSLLLTVCICGGIAVLLDREIIRWDSTGITVLLGLLVSSFIGSKLALKRIKRKNMQVCLISGMTYWLMLLCFTALFFHGIYDAVGVSGAVILSGSLSAGLTNRNTNRGGRTYHIPVLRL